MACTECGSDTREGARFCDNCGAALTDHAPTGAAVLPGPVAEGRYVAQRLLGVGARKDVFLATDTRLGRDVALALVRTSGLDDAGRQRIDREARVMAKLGDHPNVVTVLDVGTHDDAPFIVSQYMGGGSLSERLEAAPDHRLPIEEALAVATAMAQALNHAHELGVVHRDVKPANVFFGADGTAQLGDFGLAAQADEARLTAEGMVVGTVAYLPPEQTLGRELDRRSDLYSLGAVLYEVVTGRPPFVGENAVAVISQHLRAEPVSPKWHNDQVPEALDDLVLRLLAKAPDDRPATAAEVLELLAAVPTTPAAPSSPLEPGGGDSPAEWGHYVGRAAEKELLSAALQEAVAGRARVVMVVGEPGIGKTRTVEELAIEASVHGARVLWGHSYEGDGGAPYLPFVEALRSYTRQVDTDQLVEVLASDIADIATLVPDLHGRIPEIAPRPQLEPEAERYRLYEAVTSFLRNAAREEPLMIVLEDLHWADKPALLLLQYLARSLGTDRILVVCTYREIELERTHPLADTLAALRREHLYDRVLLQGMGVDEVRALISAISGGRDVPEIFAQRLHTETRGNPFFVAEILQHLVESGSLHYEDGTWVGTPESVEMALPEGVRDVIGRRLDRLSEACNRMLTVAAAMTSGFDLDAVQAVSGIDEEAALDALDEALAARIVAERRDTRGSFDFTHALIRQTLYAELSTPRRARLHRQLLEVLEARGADVTELAHHAFQSITAGDIEVALDYAIQAGDQAMEALAYEDAVLHRDMAIQALDLAPQPDQARRCELLLPLARANRFAGELGVARRLLHECAAMAEELGRPDLLGLAALEHSYNQGPALAGYDERFLDLCERADRALSGLDEHRGLLASVLAMQARHVNGISTAVAQPLATRALELATHSGDRGAIYASLRTIRVMAPDEHLIDAWRLRDPAAADGDPISHAELNRRLASVRPEDDPGAESDDVASMVMRGMADADGATYRRGVARGGELADQTRSPIMHNWSDFWAGGLATVEGRFADASQRFRDYSRRSETLGVVAAQTFVGIALVPSQRERGRSASLLPGTRRIVSGDVSPAWKAGLGVLLIDEGETDEALALLEEMVIEHPERLAPEVVVPYARAMFAEIAAALGHTEAGQVLFELMEADVNDGIFIGVYVWHGPTDRYRGLLATLLGRHDEAVALQHHAIELARRMGSPPWEARGRYDLARALLARGRDDDRDEALTLLNDALVIASDLGMTKLIEEVTEQKLLLQGIDPRAEVSGSIASVASSVARDRPPITGSDDGTVTLLFSDIEGYSAMNDRLGDARAHEVLKVHNEILRRHLSAQAGTEIKSEGDGFMLTFPEPVAASRFALGFNAELAALDLGPDVGELRVRMGIHTGKVIHDDDDLFGRTVIIAARIAAQAEGGEVLLSGEAAALVREHHLAMGASRDLALKGLSGTHSVRPLSPG